MPNPHPNVLAASGTCLVVVDVQERFAHVMDRFQEMASGSVKLVRAFRALELPVLVTEQYPKGLGTTIEPLRDALSGLAEPIQKMCFSSCGSEAFSDRLLELGTEQAVVCGIETHVCVSQTVHDLLQRGIRVHVPVDAVASRKEVDRETALRKMERSGALLTTTETVAFELLVGATHPKFKEVQALFK